MIARSPSAVSKPCRPPPNSSPTRAMTAKPCATGWQNAEPRPSSHRARTARSNTIMTRPSTGSATSSSACFAASRTRIATRFDRNIKNFIAAIALAAAVIWWPRLLKKSDGQTFSVSAYGSSGHFVSALALCRGGFALFTWLFDVSGHGSGEHWAWRRSCRVRRQAFEVLDGGGEQELVASAGQAA